MKLIEHFENYMGPLSGKPGSSAQAARNYPVVAINYHKLWDNLPAMMAALGTKHMLQHTNFCGVDSGKTAKASPRLAEQGPRSY